MKFELHCHSMYSKGNKITWEAFMSPREIVKSARNKGISGIAITDHDNSDSWKQAKRAAREYGVVFIPGIEISSSKGHVIGLGLNEHIEGGLSLEETIEKIHQQGGLAIAPHPFDLRGHGIKNEMDMADVVEVFNSMNMDRLSNRLASSKAEEFGKPVVVGSDAHTEDMLGLSLNEINANDVDGALKEIRSGRAEISRTGYITLPMIMDWSKERFVRSYMDVMRYINDNYSKPRAWVARRMLRSFVLSRSRTTDKTWELLANVGLGCSIMYGGLRFLTYY